MEHPIDHIIDILIAVIVLFLFPILFFGLKQDAIVQTLVETQTEQFVQDIRSNGYLNKDMYEAYVNDLSATGLLYNISLEHNHYSLEPEYRFRTEDEIIEEQDKLFTGDNIYTYIPVHTDIPYVVDPIDNSGNLNTETNESILAGAVRTPPSPSHIHTDACYNGTKHIHKGNSSSGGECYGNGSSDRCSASLSPTGSDSWGYAADCSECGGVNTLGISIQRNYYTCDEGHENYYSISTYACSDCGWSDIDEDTVPSSCESYETIYSQNCGKIEGLYYDADGNEVSSVCHQIITEISPTNPIQTVYTNDSLITTIHVTYMDGSTDILKVNTSFSTAEVVQNKSVALTYVNVVGSTSKAHTCDITVTIIPRNKTCSHGHTYNLNSDGTDPNCPFCKAYLIKLEVFVPSNAVLEIYKGTTLASNGVTLLATYMDGRTQYLNTEYVDNLDTNYVGTQTVTLSYKGKYVYLSVTSKRNLIRCSVCNRQYELYPDGSDPGCPFCAARTPVFTGNILEYENSMYEADILKKIYDNNEAYKFSMDDYVQVKVTNRTKGLGNGILGAIIKGINQDYIHVKSGGFIREEKRN